MSDMSWIDWEDAFANGAYIPEAAAYPQRWAEEAAAFRSKAEMRADIAYGDHPRERFDLFMPKGGPRGLVVFVHGGYWLNFDKSTWSALAAGPLAHGFAVAMPSYVLAPEARIAAITKQIGRAVAAAAAMVDGPIRLAGHSAGGHLVTRMVCKDTPLAPDVASRIERVVSISGLHDLRPLMANAMRDRLGLTDDEAAAESAALKEPLQDVDLTAWVGAHERPEFLRQSALIREAWAGKGLRTRLVADPDRHHFDVVEGLKSADHPLTLALAG